MASALMQVIRERRSIRKFKDKAVPLELIRQLIEAARWAPSAKNAQPWRFIIVRDRSKIERFAEIKGQPWIKSAPVIVFVVADRKAHPTYYAIDCARATQNFCLMAHALGLGTCIIACYELDDVRKMLKLPDDYVLVEAIAVGWPDEKPKEKPRLSVDELVYFEEFGRKSE